ncbi:MAG: hypothetical protein AB1649_32180 [Chloroflexota bacterium]
MKTRRIPVIANQRLAAVVVLALAQWVPMAESTATLDERLIPTAGRRDVALIKSLLDKCANINARNHIKSR